MLAKTRRHLGLPLVLLLVGCEGADPSGTGGSGGGGDSAATTWVGGVTSATLSASASSWATSGSSTSATTGQGGGTGGAPATLECADASLVGVGGCDGAGGGAEPADDCATEALEGCTTRALCGPAAPPIPRAAGPGVAFGERDGGVGSVDGGLGYVELIAEGYILGTSQDGRAIVRDGALTSEVVSVLHADGSRGASWNAPTFDRADVTGSGHIVIATGLAQFASIDGLAPEGDGRLALAALTGDGGVAWARRFGRSEDPSSFPEIRGLAALGDDIVIVGLYERTFDLGGVVLPEVLPLEDLGYVARIDGGTGDVLWAQPVGHPFGGTANAVEITDDGDILVGGAVYPDATSFGTVAALFRLTPDGDVVWEAQTETTTVGGRQAISSLAVTPSGVVVGAGFFTSVLRVGDEVVVNDSFGADAMVLSFDVDDGAITSLRTWGSSGLDDPFGASEDRATSVHAFCDHVVVSGYIDERSRAIVAGHAIDNPTEAFMRLVLELPAEGTWPTDDDIGDVCGSAVDYCEARVSRTYGCGGVANVSSCLEDEPCLAAMLRADVACEVRTCEAEAPCDVDCDDVGLDTVLTEAGAAFEAACEAAIGEGCVEYLPVGTCTRMAHRHADPYLEALLPCVSPARSCISTWMCLEAVDAEWSNEAGACGPEPADDPAICADGVALCAAVAARNDACDILHGSATADACLAGLPAFEETYREEVRCLIEACFAQAACNVECRDRAVFVAPSALGEALIEGCIAVGSCADLFTGECAALAHVWPDDVIAAALPCFDGSLSCEDAADCMAAATPNAWYP